MSTRIQNQVTIESGETVSSSIEIIGLRGSFQLPAEFDGIEITPDVSNDGTNWTAGTAIAVAASGNYEIPNVVFSYKFLRFTATTQQATTDSVITLHLVDQS